MCGWSFVRKRGRRAAMLVALLGCGLAVPAAEADGLAITGQVTDASGLVLPGVLVIAETGGEEPSAVVTTASGDDGRYSLGLAPGRYRVSYRLLGYATLVAPQVTIEETSLELPVTLNLALASSIVVSARSTYRNLASVGSAFDLVGVADAASSGVVAASQMEERSLLRPADVLERVPGLVVSQHSGEGKGNQYYVRGFNIDHGTDLALEVAGVPVNLPTHAHGQGYADANFLIPELASGIQFHKGPYHASAGDFSAAGSVQVDYLSQLDRPLLKLEAGEGDYERALFAASPRVRGGHLLAAIELVHKDGPWVSPDDFGKVNAVLKYSQGRPTDGFSVTGLFYDADWYATDQIPTRSTLDGRLSRFGTIDPSDGGRARRASLSAEWQKGNSGDLTRVSAFVLRNELNLWSNFTYGLDDPVNGDQFEQEDRRWIFGLAGGRQWNGLWGGRNTETRLGAGVRHDAIGEVGLYTNRHRARLSTTRRDSVDETSLFAWAESTLDFRPWFRTTVGLRADHYLFDVRADLSENSGKRSASLVSPKIGLALGPWGGTELYANAGFGFHSNDARGTTIRIDPRTGEAAEPVDPLVRAKGAELGLRTLALRNVHATVAVWGLDLDSELLYVGDAGATEVSRPSRRLGIECAIDIVPRPWLSLDASLAWSRARFTDQASVGNRIPGAIEGVVTAGAAVHNLRGWLGNLRWRYLGPRPLLEDDSVRSKAAHLVTAQIGYTFNERVTLKLDVFNLFDAKVSDIDYFYASRVPGEPAGGVEDIHFHPMEPLTLRFGVAVRF
jgi:hypothetical protein